MGKIYLHGTLSNMTLDLQLTVGTCQMPKESERGEIKIAESRVIKINDNFS